MSNLYLHLTKKSKHLINPITKKHEIKTTFRITNSYNK